MPSSRRVIKSSYAIEDLQESIIHTTYDLEMDEDEIVEEEIFSEESNQKEEILQQAEEKAAAILKEAQKEAEALKSEAQTLGFEQGEKSGYEQGLQAGFNEGVKQAEATYEEKEQHLIEMMQQANEQMNNIQKDVKEKLLSLSIQMAEKIIHKQIDASDAGVLDIAKPYFFQLDKNEELVILTVHPEALEKVNENIHKVEALTPESRIVVLSNPQLETNGLIVETSKSVVDFQIKKQLENMLKEFIEMERTIDG